MSIRSFDFYILLFMALLATYSGIMFYGERPEFSRSDKDIIATLSLRQNTVKIKPVNTVAWVDAVSGDLLASKDQIYTHQNSEAHIGFKNGSVIELSENTLFKIDRSGDKTLLKLERGAIQASLKGAMSSALISISGKSLNLQSSNARFLVVKEKGKSKIAILDGKLSVIGKGKALSISKNQVLEVDHKSDRQKVVKIEISSLYPSYDAKLRSTPDMSIPFRWEGSASRYHFQLSRDLSFKKLLFEHKTTKKVVEVPAKFSGKLYWRVGAREKWSVPSRVHLLKKRVPTLLFPKEGQVAKRLDSLDQEEGYVVLRWKDLGDVTYHINVVSPNNKSINYESRAPSLLLDGLIAGKYKIRIDVTDSVGKYRGLDSHFKVEERLKLVAPTLMSPKDGAKQTLFQKDAIEVNLVWHSPFLGLSHQIEIKDSSDRVSLSKVVSSNTFTWSVKKFGDYFWRVRTIDGNESSPFSSWRKITLSYVDLGHSYPEQGTKLKLSRPNQKVKFQWNKGGVRKYIFELSKDDGFNNIVQKKILKSNFVNVSFPDVGIYYWRTRILDESGNVSYSRPVKVLVSPTPPPTAPKLFDEQEIEIDLKKVDRSSLFQRALDFLIPTAHADEFKKVAVIKWPKDSSASKYVLEVFRDEKMQKKLLRRILTENEFELVDPEPGVYYWRIAIIDHWGRQSPYSNLAKFNLILSDKLSPFVPTKLSSPKHRSKVSRSFWRGELFKWEADSRSVRYQLDIASDLSFDNIIISKKTTSSSIRIALSAFESDVQYYWRVTSFGKYGQKQLSKRRVFTVKSEKKRKKNKVAALPTNRYQDLNRQYLVGYAPHSLDYSYVGTESDVELDGTSLSSVRASAAFQFGKKNWGTADLMLSKNSAFEQDQNSYELKIGYDRSYFASIKTALFYGGGVHLSSVTTYTGGLVDKSDLSGQSELFFAPYLAGKVIYDIRHDLSVETSLSYSLLGFDSLSASAGVYYFVSQRVQLGLVPFYVMDSYDSDDGELDQSKIGVSFNVKILRY